MSKIIVDDITTLLMVNITKYNNIIEINKWNNDNNILNDIINEDLDIIKDSNKLTSISNILIKKTSYDYIKLKDFDYLDRLAIINKYETILKEHHYIFDYIYNKYDINFEKTFLLVIYFYIKNLIKKSNSLRLQVYFLINSKYISWIDF